MEQKHIGVILIIVSFLITGFVYMAYSQNNAFADEFMAREGTCFLDDGTCLHRRNLPLYIVGWGISAALLLFGIYIGFIDKTSKVLSEHQIKVSSALESAKKQEREKDEFNAYLKGFGEEEQNILKAVKDQEGILQSTLRYRTGMSKTALSLKLKQLEDKGVITRTPSGKTKKVYVVKKF